nr:hypothetical protein [Tanacetum cinerariifolium]
MSSLDSAVTYTSISSEDVPLWGIRFFGMEQPDSPEAALQSPIQTPPVPQDEDEREPMFIQSHDPDYVPKPMYPEYILLEDEHVLPVEEQPLPPVTLRIASTEALIDAVTAALTSPLLLPLPPPLYIPPPVDRRDDIPETELPTRYKSCLFALGPRYEVGESSTARPTGGRGIDYGYGIRDTWVDSAEAVPEITPMTLGEVNTRVTMLPELHEHDTQDLYALLEDAQDSRTHIS